MIAPRSRRSSAVMAAIGDVEGRRGQEHLGLCLGQADQANSLEPHSVLEGGGGGLDGGPHRAMKRLLSLEPRRRLGMVFVSHPYDVAGTFLQPSNQAHRLMSARRPGVPPTPPARRHGSARRQAPCRRRFRRPRRSPADEPGSFVDADVGLVHRKRSKPAPCPWPRPEAYVGIVGRPLAGRSRRRPPRSSMASSVAPHFQ